ncbi:MAG: AAA family ATPase [Dehalococcoidia bacterium]
MTATIAGVEHQPQAELTLEAALRSDDGLAHAYLFHGPSGTGKRLVARAFAAALLSASSDDPQEVERRVRDGVHPDLAWVEPRGAHEILVDDVRERVVSQAALRPFESARRVFVIADADRMNDESQNALLKTLEEPAPFAVYVLTSSSPGRLLPTIPSRCRQVRFGPLPSAHVAELLGGEGVDPNVAAAAARLAGGDIDGARRLAGPLAGQRAEAEAAARATMLEVDDAQWRVSAPWSALLERADAAGADAEACTKTELDELLEVEPKRGRSINKTEYERQLRRARRRAHTASLDLSLELLQLWFRDLIAVACEGEAQVFNVDRLEQLRHDAGRRDVADLVESVALVEETRRHLERNVIEELALEALFDRLRRLGS